MSNETKQNEDFNLYLDETSRVSALDLYEDLLCIDNDKGTTLTATEVNIEKRQLEEQNQLLLQQLSNATANLKSITEQNNALKQNFACLLETAKTELERKNKVIARLSGVSEPQNKSKHQRQVTEDKGKNILSLKGRRIDEKKSSTKAKGTTENLLVETKSIGHKSSHKTYAGDSGLQLLPEKLVPPDKERVSRNYSGSIHLKRKHSQDDPHHVKRSKDSNKGDNYEKLKDPHRNSRDRKKDFQSSSRSRERSSGRVNKSETKDSDSRRHSHTNRTDSLNLSRSRDHSPSRASKEKHKKEKPKRDFQSRRDLERDRTSDLRHKLGSRWHSTEKSQDHLNASRQSDNLTQSEKIKKDAGKKTHMKLPKAQTKTDRRTHTNETDSLLQGPEVIRVVEPLKRKADSSTDLRSDKKAALTTDKDLSQIPVLGKIQETSHFCMITENRKNQLSSSSANKARRSNQQPKTQTENVHQKKGELFVKKGVEPFSILESPRKSNLYQCKRSKNKAKSPIKTNELETRNRSRQSVLKPSLSSKSIGVSVTDGSAKFDIPNLDIYDQLDFNEDSLVATFGENSSKSPFKQQNKHETEKESFAKSKANTNTKHLEKKEKLIVLKVTEQAPGERYTEETSKCTAVPTRSLLSPEKTDKKGSSKQNTSTLPAISLDNSLELPSSTLLTKKSKEGKNHALETTGPNHADTLDSKLVEQVKSPVHVVHSSFSTTQSSNAVLLTHSHLSNAPTSNQDQSPPFTTKKQFNEMKSSVENSGKQNRQCSTEKTFDKQEVQKKITANKHLPKETRVNNLSDSKSVINSVNKTKPTTHIAIKTAASLKKVDDCFENSSTSSSSSEARPIITKSDINGATNNTSIGESFMHYYRNASLHCLLHLARKKLSVKKCSEVKEPSQSGEIESPDPIPTKSREMWLASLEECQLRRKLRNRWMSERSDDDDETPEVPATLAPSAAIKTLPSIEASSTSCASLSWTTHEESMNRFFGLADVAKIITPIKSGENKPKGCATELKKLQQACRKVFQSPSKL